MLRQWLIATCLAVPLAAVAADAAPTAQQQKMTTCNKAAGDKKLSGDARKSFMSQCLSADGSPGAAASNKKMTQQEKMSACNKDAGAKKLAGDDRKKFMSNCLSG